MKTHNERLKQTFEVNKPEPKLPSDALRLAVQRTKADVMFAYAARAGQHANLLRLALNEAEGLAWQTELPHLMFPTLALEKAEAVVAWHQRQTALRHPVAEEAFAE